MKFAAAVLMLGSSVLALPGPSPLYGQQRVPEGIEHSAILVSAESLPLHARADLVASGVSIGTRWLTDSLAAPVVTTWTAEERNGKRPQWLLPLAGAVIAGGAAYYATRPDQEESDGFVPLAPVGVLLGAFFGGLVGLIVEANLPDE